MHFAEEVEPQIQRQAESMGKCEHLWQQTSLGFQCASANLTPHGEAKGIYPHNAR